MDLSNDLIQSTDRPRTSRALLFNNNDIIIITIREKGRLRWPRVVLTGRPKTEPHNYTIEFLRSIQSLNLRS